eukprot:6280327-Prymnesium_polylepis.1
MSASVCICWLPNIDLSSENTRSAAAEFYWDMGVLAPGDREPPESLTPMHTIHANCSGVA